MSRWYKIDNAGKIFHAVSKVSNSSVYRVSLTMKETINTNQLQKALDIVIRRFPTLAVKVRKGLFWDFLEDNKENLVIQEETTYPCHPINPKENNGYLLRVLYYKRKISVEIFHSLTDGVGAIEFIKTLIYQYLILQGEKISVNGDLLIPSESPNIREMEDSFDKYFQEKSRFPFYEKVPRSVQVKGTPFKYPGVNVVHGVICASDLNSYAKGLGASMTEFISSLLIYSIYSETKKDELNKGNITIALPVNLRRLFPSITLRNFFKVVNVGISANDDVTLEKIIAEISTQLRNKTDKSIVQEDINRYVYLQRNIVTRMIPLFFKYYAMRYGFQQFGEMAKTATISNMGNVILPASMNRHIERMEAIIYPTSNSPINCGICTINNQMTITFARSIEETDIIKSFFSQLSHLTGLKVEVYSNNWGVDK